MFLSQAQLLELTGYKQPACQIRWLTENSVKHWVSRTGRPVVPCSAIDGRGQQDDDAAPGLELGHVA